MFSNSVLKEFFIYNKVNHDGFHKLFEDFLNIPSVYTRQYIQENNVQLSCKSFIRVYLGPLAIDY